jgi:cytochrome c oxidase subunit 3
MSTLGVTSPGPTVEIRPGRSLGWWGMMALIATEGVLFGLLIFVYFYFRAGLTSWPPADLPMPELPSTIVRTVLLVGSSLPFMLAERALEHRRDPLRAAVWVLVAEALAAIFLIGHVQEQFKLWTELAPTETSYGSTVMTILNFHAVHLIVGMAVGLFAMVHLLRGRITPERGGMLTITGIYWHYVDVIWVVVFSTIYLSPYLLGN